MSKNGTNYPENDKKKSKSCDIIIFELQINVNIFQSRGFIMRRREINMLEGAILPQMIRFAIPVILTGLFQQLFNTADVILAGQLLSSGADAVAAVGSTTSLTGLLINFFIGCSTGSAVVLSRTIGSGEREKIKNTVHTAVLLAVVLGALLTVTGVTFSETLLTMMSTPKEYIKISTVYMQAYFCGIIPYMVYNFGAAILRAVGETKKPLYFLLISGPLKLIFTFIFVKGFKLDVAGLAFATSFSQLVSAVLVILALVKREDDCKLIIKEIKFSKEPLKKILALGIPSGIQSATFSLSSVFVQSSVNSLSYLKGFTAGNAAAGSFEVFANVLTTAFYQCSMNFTGQNAGAGKYDRVHKTLLVSAGLCTASVVAVSVLTCLFPSQILSLYIKNSPDAIYWGTVRLMVVFIPLVFQGLMDVFAGVLRGLEKSFSTMVISILGACVFRIIWGLTIFKIPQYHTPQILFMCYPISWVLTTLAQVVLYVITIKQKNRPLN